MKTHKGFTLIELIVVMAIIGIIGSVIALSANETKNRKQDERSYCLKKGMYTKIMEMPAVCVKYFTEYVNLFKSNVQNTN